jgi:hypothetical protein
MNYTPMATLQGFRDYSVLDGERLQALWNALDGALLDRDNHARWRGEMAYKLDCVENERDALRAEVERLRSALHEIAEEWAGAECGEPVHAQEAYAIGLARRMYSLAAAALTPAEVKHDD